MREFEQKRKARKILSSPILLVPLALVFLFLVRGAWSVYLKDRASVNELRMTEDRLARAKDRQNQISSAIDKLQTETGMEAEIRDKLQMGREGEREVVILDDVKKVTASSDSGTPNFLQKIWNFIVR